MIGRRALALGGASLALLGCKPSDKRLQVALWFSYGGKNREVLLDLVRRFNDSQTDLRIVPTYQGDYFEALAKLRTALAAGIAPAVTHVVGEVVPYLEHAGVLEHLDEYEGAGTLGLVRSLGQAGAFQDGDQRPLCAIPFNRSTPIMYLNRDVLDARGLSPPGTWDELREVATELASGDRYGFEVPISWWFWVAMVGQAGGALLGPKGEVLLGGAAGEKALSYWQSLVKSGVMRPPPGRDYNAWQVVNQDFLAGRVAMIWTSTAYLRYLEETARFRILCAKLPRDVKRSVPTGGTFFVIPKAAAPENKKAAWTFLRFMCETEQARDWATRTGYLPVTEAGIQALTQSGYYDKHPNDRVAVSQLADVEPWPWSKDLFRIQRDVVEPRLEGAVASGRDAREVMADARRDS